MNKNEMIAKAIAEQLSINTVVRSRDPPKSKRAETD